MLERYCEILHAGRGDDLYVFRGKTVPAKIGRSAKLREKSRRLAPNIRSHFDEWLRGLQPDRQTAGTEGLAYKLSRHEN
jgi:hypothetical protein